MRIYNKTTHWELNRRIGLLKSFRSQIDLYFSSSQATSLNGQRSELPTAVEARSKINHMLSEVILVMQYSGISAEVTYTTPAVVGGRIQNINVIQNLFGLTRFHISHSAATDFIDIAIGRHEYELKRAKLRSFNPFFYIGILFTFLAVSPFKFVANLGFNREKIEDSPVGKIVKGWVYLLTSLISLFTLLQLIGLLDPVKYFIHASVGL